MCIIFSLKYMSYLLGAIILLVCVGGIIYDVIKVIKNVDTKD